MAKKFAPGQKRIEALNILRAIMEENKVDNVRTVPLDAALRRFIEAQLVITDPAIALARCQKNETRQIISGLKEGPAKLFYSQPAQQLAFPVETLEEELEKGVRRYVWTEDVVANANLRRQVLLDLRRRVRTFEAQFAFLGGEVAEVLGRLREVVDSMLVET